MTHSTQRLNVALLVVDSLRYQSLTSREGPSVAPFLNGLSERMLSFSQAYATECWTLPTHVSMFTGLMPSEHQAHFQSMGYYGRAPTVAELLTRGGYHTEVITRNSIFDGSIPGVTRGFRENTRVLSDLKGRNPLALALALSKPRFRRQIQTTGFFHPRQRESRKFLADFSRAVVPADREALTRVLERMSSCRDAGRPYFLFCNLYDVHAPYPPTPQSILRPPWSLQGVIDAVLMPFVLPKLGGHAYLRRGFRMWPISRRMLLQRYRDAIGLMDGKIAEFYGAAKSARLLDDTILIITSDHGEAFGEHGLYLHDASAYNTHVHVPLYVHHPDHGSGVVDDIVSTRDLFGLIRSAQNGGEATATLLDPDWRARHPIALAEHFYYPHIPDALPRYRGNLVAAVARDRKVLARSNEIECFDLASDPEELFPQTMSRTNIMDACRSLGTGTVAATGALDHLASFRYVGQPVGQ